jgi:hypothetical protein
MQSSPSMNFVLSHTTMTTLIRVRVLWVMLQIARRERDGTRQRMYSLWTASIDGTRTRVVRGMP